MLLLKRYAAIGPIVRKQNHPQNRKCITYGNAAQGGPSHGYRQKFGEFRRVVPKVTDRAFSMYLIEQAILTSAPNSSLYSIYNAGTESFWLFVCRLVVFRCLCSRLRPDHRRTSLRGLCPTDSLRTQPPRLPPDFGNLPSV